METYCRDKTDPIALKGGSDFVAEYEIGEIAKMKNGSCGKGGLLLLLVFLVVLLLKGLMLVFVGQARSDMCRLGRSLAGFSDLWCLVPVDLRLVRMLGNVFSAHSLFYVTFIS